MSGTSPAYAITNASVDGVTIRIDDQRYIDALQRVARRLRSALAANDDLHNPSLVATVGITEAAVGMLDIRTEVCWTADHVRCVWVTVHSLLALIDTSSAYAALVADHSGISIDVLRRAVEPIDMAVRLIVAARLDVDRAAQTGGV